jgi:hypothetical protein
MRNHLARLGLCCWLALVASEGLAQALVVYVRHASPNYTISRRNVQSDTGVYVRNFVFGVEYTTAWSDYLVSVSTSPAGTRPGFGSLSVTVNPNGTVTVRGYIPQASQSPFEWAGFYQFEDTRPPESGFADGSPFFWQPLGQVSDNVISLTPEVESSAQTPTTQPGAEMEAALSDVEIPSWRLSELAPSPMEPFPTLYAAIARMFTNFGLSAAFERPIVTGISPSYVAAEVGASHAAVVQVFDALGPTWTAIKSVFSAAVYVLVGWVAFRWTFQAIGIQGEAQQ